MKVTKASKEDVQQMAKNAIEGLRQAKIKAKSEKSKVLLFDEFDMALTQSKTPKNK